MSIVICKFVRQDSVSIFTFLPITIVNVYYIPPPPPHRISKLFRHMEIYVLLNIACWLSFFFLLSGVTSVNHLGSISTFPLLPQLSSCRISLSS